SVGKNGREIFGMPIPDALLTDAIKRAPYYGGYQAHDAEYQKYLEEERSKAEGKAVPKPPKAKVTKPKVSKPASDTAPKPTSSQPPKPTHAPTGSTKIIQGKATKNHMLKSTLKLVDEFVNEGVPVKEPAYLDEETDIQQALELSLKEQEECTQGPARLMVIRETEYGKFQPLPQAQGKGKEKVTDEQAAHDLLTLQTQKRKTLAEQFIFQRRTSMITGLSRDDKSLSLDAESELADSEMEFDKPDISTSTLVVNFSMTSHLMPTKRRHAEAEVELIVTVTIQQDTSSVPPMQFKAHEDHKNLYEALQNSLECEYSNQLLADLDEARRKKRKKHDSPRTPSGSPHQQPPPPPPAGASGALGTSGTSGSSQPPLPPPTSSTGTSRERPASLEPAWTIPSSNMIDVENNWAIALASTYVPPTEHSLLAKIGDMITFMNWYCQQVNKTGLTQADLEGQAYEVIKAFHPDVVHLQFQMEECHKPALSISKIKAARYPDFRLELLKFYIDHHAVASRRKKVRTHMRILSAVRILAFSRYGYDYLKEIVLRIADYQEYTIAEKDFKNLYPSDFEDLNLLLLQGHLDHLTGSDKCMLSTTVNLWTRNLVIRQRVEGFQLVIESYQKQLNLTKPRWDAKGYDDGTLMKVLEALDYRVKEYKVNQLNPETHDQKDLLKLEMLCWWSSRRY
nr:hypothetical protein [Tanacetum cinerariifolium]